MKNNIKLIITVVIAIILIVVVYINNNSSNDSNVPEIKIGVVMGLTGAGAAQGEAILNGMMWKVDELNQDGNNYKLLVEDSKSDAAAGVSAFTKLFTIDKAKIIFTHLTPISLATKPLAEENKILEWAYSAHPEITTDSSYILRHAYDSEFDARAITDHITNRSLKNILIVYQQEPYGESFNNNLTKFLQESGVAVSSIPVNNKSTDFRPELTKVKASNPDAVVFVILGSGSGLVVKQIREIGYTGDIYSSAGFSLSPEGAEIAGDSAKGMYYQTDQYDPTQNSEFSTEYEKRFGSKAHINVGLGYVDLEIIDYAIKNVGISGRKDFLIFSSRAII
jgi:branched-chain amino acid transport system substrate-binding protein